MGHFCNMPPNNSIVMVYDRLAYCIFKFKIPEKFFRDIDYQAMVSSQIMLIRYYQISNKPDRHNLNGNKSTIKCSIK